MHTVVRVIVVSSAPQEDKQGNDADQDHSARHSDCNGDDGGPRQRGAGRSCNAQRCPSQHQHSLSPNVPFGLQLIFHKSLCGSYLTSRIRM